jgi:hypothetical protein
VLDALSLEAFHDGVDGSHDGSCSFAIGAAPVAGAGKAV